MVDLGLKGVSRRRAVAESTVRMNEAAFDALIQGGVAKGDVSATVRLAAIMAVKKTSDLIPLCHPLSVESVTCDLDFSGNREVVIRVCVEISGKTGVEMEALTGVSVAALTLYDMLKALDKGMVIGPTRLLEKSGGKSGPYLRECDSDE